MDIWIVIIIDRDMGSQYCESAYRSKDAAHDRVKELQRVNKDRLIYSIERVKLY